MVALKTLPDNFTTDVFWHLCGFISWDTGKLLKSEAESSSRGRREGQKQEGRWFVP